MALWGAQTAFDSMDPSNNSAALGASGLPIHLVEVVDGGAGCGFPTLPLWKFHPPF